MIYIQANYQNSLDDPIAHDYTLELSKRLETDFDVTRFLPCNSKKQFDKNWQLIYDYARKHEEPVISLKIVCYSTESSRFNIQPRLTPVIYSHELDKSGLDVRLMQFMEFYGLQPRLLINGTVCNPTLVKIGVVPITIDLGRYHSAADSCAIRSTFNKSITALDRALHHHLDNHIGGISHAI